MMQPLLAEPSEEHPHSKHIQIWPYDGKTRLLTAISFAVAIPTAWHKSHSLNAAPNTNIIQEASGGQRKWHLGVNSVT